MTVLLVITLIDSRDPADHRPAQARYVVLRQNLTPHGGPEELATCAVPGGGMLGSAPSNCYRKCHNAAISSGQRIKAKSRHRLSSSSTHSAGNLIGNEGGPQSPTGRDFSLPDISLKRCHLRSMACSRSSISLALRAVGVLSPSSPSVTNCSSISTAN